MTVIIGLFIVLAAVFGGYLVSGGSIVVIAHAVPHELIVIGGAAIGSYIIANPKGALKDAIRAIISASKGHKWHKSDYTSVFVLLSTIFKIGKTKGLMTLEGDIDDPQNSEIFQKYPKILEDPFALSLICDTLRNIITHVSNPYEIEDMVKDKISRQSHVMLAPAHALQNMADGLPAIGIVAAVLGVIQTMASVDQPPKILGAMIGSALVGTFLGVFLSYCLIGPLANKIKHRQEKDLEFYYTICDLFVYYMKGNPPSLVVEIARSIVAEDIQPSAKDIEDALSK